jgi:hypothetical protein
LEDFNIVVLYVLGTPSKAMYQHYNELEGVVKLNENTRRKKELFVFKGVNVFVNSPIFTERSQTPTATDDSRVLPNF